MWVHGRFLAAATGVSRRRQSERRRFDDDDDDDEDDDDQVTQGKSRARIHSTR